MRTDTLSKQIDRELYRASLQFVKNSELFVNKRAIERINKRGYIKSARVVQVTKCDDIVKVTLRADGAKIDINVSLNELDRVYSNPIAYAEKYL